MPPNINRLSLKEVCERRSDKLINQNHILQGPNPTRSLASQPSRFTNTPTPYVVPATTTLTPLLLPPSNPQCLEGTQQPAGLTHPAKERLLKFFNIIKND